MTFHKIEIWIKEVKQGREAALYRNVIVPVQGGEGEEIETLQQRRGWTGTPVGESTR